MPHVEVTLHTDAPSYTKHESKWWAKLLEGVNLKEVGGWALKGSWLKFRPWQSCRTYRVGSMKEGSMIALVATSCVGFWARVGVGGGLAGLFRVKEGAVHEHKDPGFTMKFEGMELVWEPTNANLHKLSERFSSPLKETLRDYIFEDHNWAVGLVYALDYSDLPKDAVMKEVEQKLGIE